MSLANVPMNCISNIITYLDIIDLLGIRKISNTFSKAAVLHEKEIKKHYTPFLGMTSRIVVVFAHSNNPYIVSPNIRVIRADLWIRIGYNYFVHSQDTGLWEAIYKDYSAVKVPGTRMPIRPYDTSMPITCIQDVILGEEYTIVKWPGGFALVDGFNNPNANIITRIAGESSKFSYFIPFDAIPREARANATEFYIDHSSGFMILIVGHTYYISKYHMIGALFASYKIKRGLITGPIMDRLEQEMTDYENSMAKDYLRKETARLIESNNKAKKQLPKKRLQYNRR